MVAATLCPKDPDSPGIIRLHDGSCVFNAELEGILLALKKFLILTKASKKFIIFFVVVGIRLSRKTMGLRLGRHSVVELQRRLWL